MLCIGFSVSEVVKGIKNITFELRDSEQCMAEFRAVIEQCCKEFSDTDSSSKVKFNSKDSEETECGGCKSMPGACNWDTLDDKNIQQCEANRCLQDDLNMQQPSETNGSECNSRVPDDCDITMERMSCNVLMVGLHCCGDLTPTMMQYFSKLQFIRGFCCVSCCFHRMQRAEGNSL